MFKIIDVSDLDVAFGGKIKELMPRMEDIPKEFKTGRTKWNKITSRWFFAGLSKNTVFSPKEGVDTRKALKHVSAILGSFEPKHEHKEAGVAFLLSEWFEDIENYKDQ